MPHERLNRKKQALYYHKRMEQADNWNETRTLEKEGTVSKKRMILLWIATVFLSFILTATWVPAKGKGKGYSSPSGWSKGEKKGWETDVPAGLEGKDKAGDPAGLTREKKVKEKKEKTEKQTEKEQNRQMNREGKQKKE